MVCIRAGAAVDVAGIVQPCRSVPTLHGRVDSGKPVTLWDPDVCIPSRVPALRALGLTCMLSVNDLWWRPGVERWKWLQYL